MKALPTLALYGILLLGASLTPAAYARNLKDTELDEPLLNEGEEFEDGFSFGGGFGVSGGFEEDEQAPAPAPKDLEDGFSFGGGFSASVGFEEDEQASAPSSNSETISLSVTAIALFAAMLYATAI